MQQVMEVARRRKNLTATGTIESVGALLGVLIGPYTAGATLKVADATSTLLNTMTVAHTAGTLIPIPVEIRGDLTITLTGTIDVTVLYGV